VKILLAACVCGWALHAGAAPLTLEQALASADAAHPELEIARADLDAARAGTRLVRSRLEPNVIVDAALRSGRPTLSLGSDDWEPDNFARILLRQPLLDFGRTDAASDAARLEEDAAAQGLIETRAARRLDIMARFLEVMLADMRYTTDNEFSAVGWVNWDRARERHAVGAINAAQLGEAEALFQDRNERRRASLKTAREARSRLAQAMNQPGDLPSELEDPGFAGNERAVPEHEALLPVLLSHNPRWIVQQQRLAAAAARVQAQRLDTRPRLDIELAAADYAREALTRDSVSAGLVLTWPLYQGTAQDARLAREEAARARLAAQTEHLRRELSQALLETLLELDHARTASRPAARVQQDYREQSLERRRAEYELELKTTLSDSFAHTMEARLRARAVEYRIALALTRLEALLGVPLDSLATATGVKP
jgi:outer membrane protein TolC